MKPAVWMVVVALYALLWSAPVGLEHFADTAPLTKAYYVVIIAAALGLLACGAWLLYRRKIVRPVVVAGLAATLALGVTQAAGIATDAIICVSPG